MAQDLVPLAENQNLSLAAIDKNRIQSIKESAGDQSKDQPVLNSRNSGHKEAMQEVDQSQILTEITSDHL